jgi:hypothetical protein
MKSRKIRRFELVLDKIKGEDSKREIMCISFGSPTKKNRACLRASMKGTAMAELKLHGQPWELTRRGREGGRGRGRGGDATRGAPWGAAGGGPRSMAAWFGPAAALCVVCMRKKAWGRKEREEREKEKERKNENFAKPGNFRGEK